MVVTIDCRQRTVDPSLAAGIFIFPFYFAWRLLEPGYSRRARLIGFGWLAWISLQFAINLVGFLTTPHAAIVAHSVAESNALSASVPQQPGKVNAPSQAQLESVAESAFKQIDEARNDYPPLGADPSNYNAAITKAYHAWERAAEAAYGTNWKSIWTENHAGSVAGCDIAHNFGMPLDACYQAAASEGDIEPLDGMLMKCPSWDDPSGAIFNPRDPEACAARKKAMAAAAKDSNRTVDDNPLKAPTVATDPSNISAGSDDASAPSSASAASQDGPLSSNLATDTEPPQQ